MTDNKVKFGIVFLNKNGKLKKCTLTGYMNSDESKDSTPQVTPHYSVIQKFLDGQKQNYSHINYVVVNLVEPNYG